MNAWPERATVFYPQACEAVEDERKEAEFEGSVQEINKPIGCNSKMSKAAASSSDDLAGEDLKSS